MPGQIRAAVEAANADTRVHVIALQGAGDAFCGGHDLKHYAEGDPTHQYTQPMPWDPMRDYALMKHNTEDFMSLWRSHKPTWRQAAEEEGADSVKRCSPASSDYHGLTSGESARAAAHHA